MGIEYEGDKLEDIARLVRENNRMLHAMRRNAFLGGLLKTIMWIALVIVPLWFYMQYLAPVMQGMLKTMNQIQGTSAGAQAQFGGFGDALKKFESQFPQYFSPKQ